MNRSDTWKTWAIVIGLLLFTAIASATWLWLSNQEESQPESQVAAVDEGTEPITISIGDYVLGKELLDIPFVSEYIEGRQLNPWLVVGVSFVLLAGLIGAMGLGLALLSLITSRQVSKVYADEDFQKSVAALNQRDIESLREIQESSPKVTTPAPQKRLRWSIVTTSFLILIMVWITGLVFGVAFFGDTAWEILGLEVSAVAVINLILVAITIIILALTIRAHEPGELDSSKTDYNPVNWNYVWIILSGALIVGIGAGLAIAMPLIPVN